MTARSKTSFAPRITSLRNFRGIPIVDSYCSSSYYRVNSPNHILSYTDNPFHKFPVFVVRDQRHITNRNSFTNFQKVGIVNINKSECGAFAKFVGGSLEGAVVSICRWCSMPGHRKARPRFYSRV